ncbi:unnamed protein product [Mytilus coruscus]|uniref:B box-type domain-containing protein n=1 Tax=Mytilus coruscus TaxID=42192 RepID=A0A6J8ASN0_MYTCO|nr:unnamed protein product [Mytilus coruscus]
MVLSKSVIKAQDIISCNLCESETKLKWKCIDCDLLMCNKCCDKIHPKFKNAKDHTIVEIKEVGVSGGVKNLDFTSIKCKVHASQSCCIFCSNCDQLACPSCITKGHAGHTFIEIKEAYEMKVEWLKNRKGKLEMKEKKLDEGDRILNEITARENSNCQKTIQDIQHQREALKREIDKHALKLIEELNQNMKSIQDSISKEVKNVQMSRQKVENNFKTAKEMLTMMDMSFFFENADIMAKSIDNDEEGVNVIHKSVPKFKPGSISLSNFGTLFKDISSSNTIIDMRVKKEFTTGIKYCHYISGCSDGSLWIGDSISNVLQKVKPEGNLLTTVSTINTGLRGIAVTHNNDLLISDGTSKLKLVNGKTGKVQKSKYSVDPLWIIGVYITSDHKVIVGAMSPGKAFSATGRRLVIVMDREGNHITVYEQDKYKQNICSYPFKITSTSNGNIFVVDRLSDDGRGRVLVLGEGGNILNEYNGCEDIKTKDQPFKPASITTTPSDKVIVTDFYNHLHILDSSANLIFYYNTKDIGIVNSYSLFFISSTIFYLGCSTTSTTNAKLYEIQCSEF